MDDGTARAARSRAVWEERYAERDRVWSGEVNATVAAVVAPLRPGAALDVGCGEGGDAVWLARRGWRVTGVDVSATAVRRAAERARHAGVDVGLVVGDGPSAVDGDFDLVLAAFLHSFEHDFPRLRLLREAADRVAAGGRLLVVSHAAPPAWADAHRHDLAAPAEELARLDLDPRAWTTERVELRSRPATAPDGTPAELEDGVLLLRRG